MMGRKRPAEPLGPRPFTTALNKKLSKPVNVANGESIFDPLVMSRYFDDPSVPDKDKQAIAFAYKPSLMTAAFDESIRQSVGEPVRSKGLLGRAMSATIDIAGKPIGKIFEGLMWGANKSEQVFGTTLSYGYDSDLSLSERWQMGRLTYEAYGQTGWWKWHGDDKLNAWSQQLASGEKTIDDLMAEHEGGVPDLVGKMILNPLWLLGGVPAVPGRLFKAGEKGAQVYKTGLAASWFRGLSEGIRMEHFGSGGVRAAEALSKIPVVGKPLYKVAELTFGSFVPTETKIFDNAIARWRDQIDAEDVEGTIKSWRDMKGLFRLTPQAKADQVANHLSHTMAAASPTQEDVIQLMRAVDAQDIKQLPENVINAFRNGTGQILFRALKEQGVDMRRFRSMTKRIAETETIWDDAIRTGGDTAKEMVRTTHRNARAFANALQEDLHQVAYPALQRWHGVPGVMKTVATKEGDVGRFIPSHSPMQKFTNMMKWGLSTTMLNRPGFAAMNLTNNGTTLAMDYGIGRGTRYWLDPSGRRGFFEKNLHEMFVEDGITPDLIKFMVGDNSTAKELLDVVGKGSLRSKLTDMGIPADLVKKMADDPDLAKGLFTSVFESKTFGIANRYWAPFIEITSRWDMGARMHAFYEMYGRARNATWKFEGTARGLLPRIETLNPELASRLGPEIVARLHGAILAAGPNAEKIRAIADDIAVHGRPPLTAEHYLEKMADAMSLEGDHRQSFMDMFEPAFRERTTAILADAGSNTERLTSRLDRLRGALRQQEHQARELDNLMPRPRDYRNLPTAVADHEALMAERDKLHLIQLRRFLVSTSTDPEIVNNTLRDLAEVQGAARQRRYVLQYTSQLLDIGVTRLESDVMFQLVPEELRPAVRAAHRELVLGLDEVRPGRTEFSEVLGDIAARWEKHSNQYVEDLTDYVISKFDNPPQPLMDFFNSLMRAEGETAAKRDHVFAEMINNHAERGAALDQIGFPETPANLTHESMIPPEGQFTNVQEWVNSRWSQHYGELDNLYNDALQREADIFGFEHRMTPHARAGENPTVGDMLGVRNSTLEQYMDFVEKNHLLDKNTQPFVPAAGGAFSRLTVASRNKQQSAVLRQRLTAAGFSEDVVNAVVGDYEKHAHSILNSLDAAAEDPGATRVHQFADHTEDTGVNEWDYVVGGMDEPPVFREGALDTLGVPPTHDSLDTAADFAPGKNAGMDILDETLREDIKFYRGLAKPGTPAAAPTGLTEYLDQIAKIAPDAKRVQMMVARGAADFTMLNYDNRYGIDHWLALVYPYAFWPTRSMWHWAQRGISRPGAVTATAKLYELIGEVNSDANIPQRFRQSIRFPIPFMDDTFQGGPMYFDPIKVLFPTADWSYDDNFDQAEGEKGNFFGVPRNAIAAVNQWAKVVGPGVNPFIDTALQHAAGDERALYLKYRFSAMPFMIPGPRQLQALWSFTQSGEDPDGLIDPDTEEAVSLGQHLPENKLKQILGLNDDEFDLYRTQRVMGNQVGIYMKQGHSIEERKAFSHQMLVEMFARKGKLWDNARKIGKHEAGLAVVTGYLFGMPVRQYPNGEDTSRGIQELYRQVQEDSRKEGSGDMTAAFTEMFPEIEIRNAALAIFDGTDKQDSEIAGALFAQNLSKVHGKYDQRITDLNAVVNSLTKQGKLKTAEGRRGVDILEAQRNALTEQRSLEIDDLDKTYTDRNQDPSLSRTPRTRAMQMLEKDYYALETPENATSLDVQKQRTQQAAFIKGLTTDQSYSPFGSAINHYATTKSFDRKITAAYDAGDREAAQKLIEERQNFVKSGTEDVKARITQKEFRAYLDRNKRVPNTQELEYDQAKDQMSEYFAIKDRGGELGYSSKETAALAGAFWDAHPLLKKYYGNGVSVRVDSYEDIARYDRMEIIWENFYSLEGGSQARIDYLAMTLDELNALRRHFGLPPIKIEDPYWNKDAPPPRYEGSNPSGY